MKADMQPCIQEGLSIEAVGENITVFHSETKKSYLLGEAEYNVLIHLDGVNTVEQLSTYSGKYSVEQVKALISQFEKMGFIKGKDYDKSPEKGLIKRKKIGIVNGNKYIKSDSICTKVLYFIFVYLSIPIFALGLYQYFQATNGFQGVNLREVIQVNFVMHIISFIIIATLHELAHAVIARKNQVPIPEIGVMMYLFIPYVYTNMSYIRLLKSQWKRILCLLGGILLNILLSGVFFFIAGCMPETERIFFEEIAFMNLFLIISNLMIFFKLDGYFILQEILEESYLREKSIHLISKKIQMLIEKVWNQRQKSKSYIKAEHRETENELFYFLYGILCIGYVPILLISFLLSWLQRIF